MAITFTRTRLAPSPTGALHLGHARTFLIAWWMARQAGAKIFMRMEDLDVGRAKPESVRQAYDDLSWLGMDWDAYEERNELVQSEHLELYAEALQQLWKSWLVYPCTCTRPDITATVAASVGAPHETDAQLRYSGRCRGNRQTYSGHSQVAAVEQAVARVERGLYHLTGKVCWRLRVEEGEVAFEDLIAGRYAKDVAKDVGDFPLKRFDGTPAYQLACVVDDHAMGIDMVVRGDDLLASTPRQLVLYRALGYERVPQFAHVPLVVGLDGKRLAKRHGESRIAQFREAGVSPEKVVGWVAWRSGQIAAPREIGVQEVLAGFDLNKVPKERVVLGKADLEWLRWGVEI